MVARGAGKNEAIVAENSLRSGRKNGEKIPPLHTQLFSLTDFVLILLILIFGPLLFLIYVSGICDVLFYLLMILISSFLIKFFFFYRRRILN